MKKLYSVTSEQIKKYSLIILEIFIVQERIFPADLIYGDGTRFNFNREVFDIVYEAVVEVYEQAKKRDVNV